MKLTTLLKTILITNATFMSIAMAATFTPFSATYSLNYNGKTGTASRTLTQSGNVFNYNIVARVSGIATANQSANFSLNTNIVPNFANTSYKVAGIGNTHNIKFNGKKAISTYKGQATTLSIPNGAYDDLSLEMQIRQELLNNRFKGTYTLVKKKDTEVTQFRKVNHTKILTPAGTYDAVRIDRIHNDKDRTTSFWLAPSLDYLPIKVVQINDGKKMEMSLTKINLP